MQSDTIFSYFVEFGLVGFIHNLIIVLKTTQHICCLRKFCSKLWGNKSRKLIHMLSYEEYYYFYVFMYLWMVYRLWIMGNIVVLFFVYLLLCKICKVYEEASTG